LIALQVRVTRSGTINLNAHNFVYVKWLSTDQKIESRSQFLNKTWHFLFETILTLKLRIYQSRVLYCSWHTMRRCSRFIRRTPVVFKNRSSLTCTYNFSGMRARNMISIEFFSQMLTATAITKIRIFEPPWNNSRTDKQCHTRVAGPTVNGGVSLLETTPSTLRTGHDAGCFLFAYLYIASVYQCSNSW